MDEPAAEALEPGIDALSFIRAKWDVRRSGIVDISEQWSDALLPDDTRAELAFRVRAAFGASITLKQHVIEAQAGIIVRMAWAVYRSLRNGGKVLFCGNGGSAADAHHLSTEMLVRLRAHLNRDPMPALALPLDSSSMMAWGINYGVENYFARMIRALGNRGDVLLAITASDDSPSLVVALQTARAIGLVTLGFVAAMDKLVFAACDIALAVPSIVSARIHETHITAGHALLEAVEDLVLSRIENSESSL